MDDSGPSRLCLTFYENSIGDASVLGMPVWGAWVLIAVLLIVSGLFSASENAFSNCDRFRFKAEAEKGKLTSKVVTYLAERFEGTLVTILVGNNIVQTLMSTMSAMIFAMICNANGWGDGVESILSTVVMGFLVYIVSDTVPKILSKSMPNRVAAFVAWPDFIVGIVLFPVIWLFRMLLKLVHRIFKVGDDDLLSREDIVEKADEAVTENELTKSEEELLEPDEVSILKKALALSSKKVGDVFTKMDKVVSIKEDELVPKELAKRIIGLPFSRYPVFDDEGKCIGILANKVFFREYYQDEHLEPRSTLFPVLEVKEGDDLLSAFASLTDEKMHMAMVEGPDGKLTGLLTLDDVLDEIIPPTEGGNRR